MNIKEIIKWIVTRILLFTNKIKLAIKKEISQGDKLIKLIQTIDNVLTKILAFVIKI
jgi:hypothetical protein